MKVSTHTGCGQSGCHHGVAMDDDEYFEGYARDTIYPPCICHPKFCKTCHGTGWAPEEIAEKINSDDCPDCRAGWTGDGPEHPDCRYEDPKAWAEFTSDNETGG